MPKRRKAGPPYTDIPNEVYVVVSYPWGMERNPRSRSQHDYDRIASWAQLVLQQGGLGGGRLATIECIYSMGTRDEIIIQFAEGTNIMPLLGDHRWANIAKNWNGPPNDHRSTRVFLYNWRDNGDPANHNWNENFPKRLPLDSVPAKSPYPSASWTSPPSSLVNFVLPIPKPQNPPPVPERRNIPDEQTTSPLPPTTATASSEDGDQPESKEQPAAQDSTSTNLFRPYEPPSQRPAHAHFLNQQAQSEDALSSQTSPSPPKFIKKLDPYELEEDALSILRAPDPVQEDTIYAKHEEVEPSLTLSIKVENPETKPEDEPCLVVPPASLGYQPSAELESYINAHLQGMGTTAPSSALGSGAEPTLTLSIKMENSEIMADGEPRLAESFPPRVVPPASLGYQPSAELEAYINAHLRGIATAPSSASGSKARETPRTRVTVKREYEEDLGASLALESKRIKIEEI